MKLIRRISLPRWALLAFILMAATHHAFGKTIEINFNKLPEDGRPAWKRVGAGTREIADSTLILNSDSEESAGYIISGGEGDYI